jgi:amino acid transporter
LSRIPAVQAKLVRSLTLVPAAAWSLVLRRTMPNLERPYRVWGYPWVPIIYLLVTVYLLVNTLMATPSRALAGIVLIILGLPVYEYFRRRAGDVVPPQWK